MSDPGRLRRCRSVHPDDPTMQCQGEVTELSMHVEDHWNASGREIVRWPVIQMPEWNPAANPDRVKASDRQEAGDHYKKFSIQPWQIWEAYGLDPWAANALKYLLRAGHKGPKLEDLKKARHYLDYMIEREEG